VKSLRASSLAIGMLMFAAASALPAPAAQAEIDYLLSAVANSNCEFNRNGSWYDPKSAADHLTTKYKYLAARDQVQSAEEFIEKAASRSSLSGRDYAVRCGGGAAVASSRWLLILLARYRESHPDALRRD
jgi:hypothetical protein